MSTLVFRLRNVPEEEAQSVRDLLDEHKLEWYETSAGNWGIAMPGIWVQDSSDAPKARSIINDYQQQHSERVRRDHESDLASGNVPTLTSRIQTQPFRMLGIVLFCLFILYVSINPFLQLIGYSQ
ncbi:MAG: DUF6164 family protein [Granulosicoccus sp.]